MAAFGPTGLSRCRRPDETVLEYLQAMGRMFDSCADHAGRLSQLRNCYLRDRLLLGLNELQLQQNLLASFGCLPTDATDLALKIVGSYSAGTGSSASQRHQSPPGSISGDIQALSIATSTPIRMRSGEPRFSHVFGEAHSTSASRAPHLPDEIIVIIFAHLSPRQLLGPVRAVCTKWHKLALDRRVWRSRKLWLSLRDPPDFLKLALAKVPCVRKLVCFDGTGSELSAAEKETLMEAAARSTCIAKDVCVYNMENPVHLVRFLAKQSGSIRTLTICFPQVRERVADVLRAVYRLTGLEALTFCWRDLDGSRQKVIDVYQAFGPLGFDESSGRHLERLTFFSNAPDYFILDLVLAYSSSLRVLDLHWCGYPLDLPSVLSICPLLSEVGVSATSDLLPLQACESLVNLTVLFDSRGKSHARSSLQKYFQSDAARRLTSLKLAVSDPQHLDIKAALACVDAIAKCRYDYALEEFRVQIRLGSHLFNSTAVALKRMPRLRLLELSPLPHADDLLDLVFCPPRNLTLLVTEDKRCAAPALLRAILEVPGLHAMAELCKHFPRPSPLRRFGLRSHDPSRECDLCRQHTNDTGWFSALHAAELPVCCFHLSC